MSAREALVIDVRTAQEFSRMAIDGALNVPLAELQHRIRDLVTDPATPLVLYCASGARSGMACGLLVQLGYADVRNAGGLFAASAQLQRPLR